MARFYLEISADDGFRTVDDYGLELACVDEARAVAAQALCDLARLTTPISGRTFTATVTDAHSDTVFTAQLALSFNETKRARERPASAPVRNGAEGRAL